MGQPSDFTGLSRRKWYLMAAGWSLLLLVPAVVALTSDDPLPVRILQLSAVGGYAACYVFGLYEGVRRRSPLYSAAVLVTMAALFLVLAGMGSGLFTVAFVVVAVIMLVPGRWGTIGAIAASAGAVLAVWLLGGALNWGEVIGMAAVCVAQIGMFGVIRINAQLRAAREELADLAVTAERERMARDLHDVATASPRSPSRPGGRGGCWKPVSATGPPTRWPTSNDSVGKPCRTCARRSPPTGSRPCRASSRARRRRCAPPGSPRTCRTPSTTYRPIGRRCSPTWCARG